MLRLVMLGGLLLIIVIATTVARLMPHATATPQQVYFHLHTDDELVARP